MKVSIVGGSGYTGFELLRILAGHTGAEVVSVSSRQYKGQGVTELFPSLRGFYDGLSFKDPSELGSDGGDIFFSALPHGASMEVVPGLLKAGKRVVDLSADFRLHDAGLYRKWYGEHGAKELLKDAVYGLPELHGERVKGASLVANPGCYPTSALLALAPVMGGGLVETGSIVIDSKSGVSGAGRTPTPGSSFIEVAGGFKPYSVGSHRHTPEMEQELSLLSGGEVSITFVPHLLPVSRGILSTIYAGLKKDLSTAELLAAYREFYAGKPFVRVLPEGAFPNINQVRGSNYCDIGLVVDGEKKRLVVVSAIDNLVKGASGQAVQNMNLMCGMDETIGLTAAPMAV